VSALPLVTASAAMAALTFVLFVLTVDVRVVTVADIAVSALARVVASLDIAAVLAAIAVSCETTHSSPFHMLTRLPLAVSIHVVFPMPAFQLLGVVAVDSTRSSCTLVTKHFGLATG